MRMTLAQFEAYTRASSRRERRRLADVALAMRVAQAEDKYYQAFLQELARDD